MAGNPTNEITISIYPSTAIFSAHYVDDLAGSGIDVTFTNSDCTVSSNYLVYETETSCSGGNTLTITAYGHQYIVSPINDNIIVNLPTQSLYAWTYSTTTYYTLSTTHPEMGDTKYDEYGNSNGTFNNALSMAVVRDSTKDIIVERPKPSNLYGWTDSSVTGEQLYGWTNGTTTVYTKSATPSSGDDYYDANGNAYGQYELTVNGFSLLIGINTYDSTNNLIKIKGDAV